MILWGASLKGRCLSPRISHLIGMRKGLGLHILKRTLHNDQWINTRGRHNNCILLCSQHRAPQYIRQTLTDTKGEIDSNAIIVGNFNITLTPMDRSSKQKIKKEAQVLNDTLDEMDLIDIFRTFHPIAEEYTFFSSSHGTFSRIDHILGHK